MFKSVIILLFIFIPITNVRASELFMGQMEGAVEVHVVDSQGKILLKGKGHVIDKEGLVVTDCPTILKWYEDIKNDLIVKTKKGDYPLYRLISYSRDLNLAIFKVNGQDIPSGGLPKGRVGSYIRKVLKIYKDMVKAQTLHSERQEGIKREKSGKGTNMVEERLQASKNAPLIKAMEYADSKRYREAIEEYIRALNIEPHNPEIYLNLGLAYYKCDKYKDSIDTFKKALLYGSPSKPIYNKLGSLYLILGRYDEAIEAFREALKLDSKDPMTHFNIALTLFMKGDGDRAWEEYIVLRGSDEELARRLWDIIN